MVQFACCTALSRQVSVSRQLRSRPWAQLSELMSRRRRHVDSRIAGKWRSARGYGVVHRRERGCRRGVDVTVGPGGGRWPHNVRASPSSRCLSRESREGVFAPQDWTSNLSGALLRPSRATSSAGRRRQPDNYRCGLAHRCFGRISWTAHAAHRCRSERVLTIPTRRCNRCGMASREPCAREDLEPQPHDRTLGCRGRRGLGGGRQR